MQSLGLIKWFDNDKNFGVIGTTDGMEVFVHAKDFIIKPEKVLKAKAVFFNSIEEKKGKNAVNVTNPETYEHFKIVMQLINTDPKVKIEVTLTGESKWGNKYKRKESKDYSIFEYAVHQLLRNKNATEIFEYFNKYFDENEFNSIEDYTKYFDVTKERVNRWVIELDSFLLEEYELDSHNNLANQLIMAATISPKKHSTFLIKKLFSNYLSKVNDEVLFYLWQKKHYYIGNKSSSQNDVENENAYFDFPSGIFLNNLDKINHTDLHRIIKRTDGLSILDLYVNNEINSLHHFSKEKTDEIVYIIKLVPENENPEKWKELLISKFFEILYSDGVENITLDKFKIFISVIVSNKVWINYDHVIEKLNNTISDDQQLMFWKSTQYFKPNNAFFLNHISQLTNDDFDKAPIEFHKEYFLLEYNKINNNGSLESHCELVILVYKVRYDAIPDIFNNLNPNVNAAYWLKYLLDLAHTNPYSQQQIAHSLPIPYSAGHFIKYVNEAGSLNNLIICFNLIKHAYYILFKERTTFQNGSTLFKLDALEKNELVRKILNNKIDIPDATPLDIMMLTLKWSGYENCLTILKVFLPKFIDIEENYKTLLELDLQLGFKGKIRNDFYAYLGSLVSKEKRVRLWLSEYIYDIDFNTVLEVFESTPVNIQPNLLRRLFSLIQIKKVNINDDLFNQLNILSNNSKLNFNVRIALFVVNALKNQNAFITDKTLFELVSQHLNEKISDIIIIDELFEECGGRVWKAYSFNPGKAQWFININGSDFYVDDNIALIDDRRYALNKEEKTIDVDGITYKFKWVKNENSFHAENYGVPDGLTFCDAVKSQYDEELKTNFYWCCNSKCYSPCQKDYNPFQWGKYTLRDFIKILGFTFDNDMYYRFVAVTNRVNRLLDKLKCKSCKKLMRDAATSEFAFYRVNTFHCTNSNCNDHHKPVYLTHCLNWKCLNVIDSRVSKPCPNGWYICDSCSNCCSQEKINRRYENLVTNAAFNPSNPRHQKLKFQVDNKLGHFENGEVFNFMNGEKMN